MSAKLSPSCSSGASATSTANPPSTSSGGVTAAGRVNRHQPTSGASRARSFLVRSTLVAGSGPTGNTVAHSSVTSDVGVAAQLLLDGVLVTDDGQLPGRRDALAFELALVVAPAPP